MKRKTQAIIATAKQSPRVFLATWMVLFLFGFGVLHAAGVTPKPEDTVNAQSTTNVTLTTNETEISQENNENIASESSNTVSDIEERREGIALHQHSPVRIIIPTINIDAPIENPSSRDVAVLDNALTKGVVHYPGSGDLEDIANVFLFGHSSHLPVIHNKNYKVFNRLPDLVEGDEILIRSQNFEYVYKVSSVVEVDASEALVEFSAENRKLTLSTCNTFGDKSDRFVVEADFVERRG